MSEAWKKYNEPSVPMKQQPSYLRLIKECNESMFNLTLNGPSILAVEELRKRIENAGINVDDLSLNNDINDNSSSSSSSNRDNDTTDKSDSARYCSQIK